MRNDKGIQAQIQNFMVIQAQFTEIQGFPSQKDVGLFNVIHQKIQQVKLIKVQTKEFVKI